MNTINTLAIDIVTRAVTGTLPCLEKLNNDLLLQISFQNQGITFDPALPPDEADIQSLSLTVSSSDTGEIAFQSDSWSRIGGLYYIHASVDGPVLQEMLFDQNTVQLLGEIQWVMANPFYNSANGNIGPSTLRTSSQNFDVTITADIG